MGATSAATTSIALRVGRLAIVQRRTARAGQPDVPSCATAAAREASAATPWGGCATGPVAAGSDPAVRLRESAERSPLKGLLPRPLRGALRRRPDPEHLFCSIREMRWGLRPYRLKTRRWVPSDRYKVAEAEALVARSLDTIARLYRGGAAGIAGKPVGGVAHGGAGTGHEK